MTILQIKFIKFLVAIDPSILGATIGVIPGLMLDHSEIDPTFSP